jgi:hypothetical protein
MAAKINPLAGGGGSNDLVVVCVDLSVGGGLYAFRQRYSPGLRPRPRTAYAYDPDGVRMHLANDIRSDLRRWPVALGLEGPLWGATLAPLGPYVARPFESNPYSWTQQVGGHAALKGLLILEGLVSGLPRRTRVSRLSQASPLTWAPGNLHLWEAFVTKAYRTAPWWTTTLPRGATLVAGGKPFVFRADLWDALNAVEHGFAHPAGLRLGPHAHPLPPGQQVVSLASRALQAVGLSARGQSDCAVIEPERRAGHLMWR